MISVSARVKKAKKDLSRVQRKQIPFALSNTLNSLAYQAQQAELNVIRQQIDRPVPFTQKAILYKKTNKRELMSKVFIPLNRWKYLKKIVTGGQSSRQGKPHAIPINKAITGKYGHLPRNKSKTLAKRKNHFAATINGRSGLWKRNKDGSLALQIVYKDTINVPKSYRPWIATARIVKSRFDHIFKQKFSQALKTGR
jgi:hypothetical protein